MAKAPPAREGRSGQALGAAHLAALHETALVLQPGCLQQLCWCWYCTGRAAGAEEGSIPGCCKMNTAASPSVLAALVLRGRAQVQLSPHCSREQEKYRALSKQLPPYAAPQLMQGEEL